MNFVVATEIEFYLFGSDGRELDVFWREVRACCESACIAIFSIEKEKGLEQHEISLTPLRDIEKIISDTEQLKVIVSEIAAIHDMRADFSAKPVADEPGSGLHVHVHLEDGAGTNIYTKQGEEMSEALAHSIAGLLANMQKDMAIFAPTQASRARFVAGSNAPLTLSWGANNRTCALRLPDTGTEFRRIEHRVSGADADVGAVVRAVLKGITHGMEHKLMPPPQIYGDASLAMYGLPRLASG